MVLCVVGDVDPDMVYDMAKRIITQPGEEITDRDYGSDEGLGPDVYKRQRPTGSRR